MPVCSGYERILAKALAVRVVSGRDQEMASGGEQKTVSLRAEIHSKEEEEELRETKDAFYEYMFRKATRDDGLSRTQASTFEAVREELVSEEEVHETGEAANLGRRLAEIGKGREREGGGGRVLCVCALFGGIQLHVHIQIHVHVYVQVR